MPKKVQIELASALQPSTRERLNELGINATDSHCLILWIASPSSGTNTTREQACTIAGKIHQDLVGLSASITAIYETVTETVAVTPNDWKLVDKPGFAGAKQGPFFVRFDFTFKDNPSSPAKLSSLPNNPTLADIEASGYTANVDC